VRQLDIPIMNQMHSASFLMAGCTELASVDDIGIAKCEVSFGHVGPSKRLKPQENDANDAGVIGEQKTRSMQSR
jgi:hypothetical protein